jgi:GTP diphosphokinase / guanosine-3',5'-bis(diphosphate) 3'-diphosphatase
MIEIDLEKEKKEILRRYRVLLKSLKNKMTNTDKKLLRKAFDLAVEMHKDMRRKSGEPYIYHPIAVAQICIDEIGLGPTSVVCALLHDVVEDTDVTLEDIKNLFNEKIAQIIDGLTKISGVIIDENSSIQAENFRKMLLTLSDDVRVILIKLADRLHNMRTLESMKKEKQLKIASETLFLYAPLAHRLGLYSIKSELEDLSLKFKEPDLYNSINNKLLASEKERLSYINKFSLPIMNLLVEKGIKFNIKSRAKGVFSIAQKMAKQEIPFEEVYDIFAIRFIIEPSSNEDEKLLCFQVFSLVNEIYTANKDRTRDWISTPRSNGYESIHTTVMGPGGRWVEVQIRSQRMDEIAEKGYAAHWKYKDKENGKESALDEWIGKIRELLENTSTNAIDFVEDIKLQLFSEEIFVFTPKGDMKRLPSGSTALDFAYEIHTQVGNKSIGAKINNKLAPLSQVLKSGDQIEIINSDKQIPTEDWLNKVITAKAKTKIRDFINYNKKEKSSDGVLILQKKLKQFKVELNESAVYKLCQFFGNISETELFYRAAIKAIDLNDIKKIVYVNPRTKIATIKFSNKKEKSFDELVSEIRGKSDTLMLDTTLSSLNYSISNCCNPIKGDDVFGFVTKNQGILIHRTNCKNAVNLMSNFSYRIIKAKWIDKEKISFLAGIVLNGVDAVGLVNNITKIISEEYNVNMRSINFETNDGVFEGTLKLYVNDTNHLLVLMDKLKKVAGVIKVKRM